LDLFLGLPVVLGTELVVGALEELTVDSVLGTDAVLFVKSVIWKVRWGKGVSSCNAYDDREGVYTVSTILMIGEMRLTSKMRIETMKKIKDEDRLQHQPKVQRQVVPSPLENLESDHTSSLRLCIPNNKSHSRTQTNRCLY
jgi:hypothetical protein